MVNWLKMESRIREIIRDVVVYGIDPKEGIIRIDECVAAHTRRGHAILGEQAVEFLVQHRVSDPAFGDRAKAEKRYTELTDKEWDHADS